MVSGPDHHSTEEVEQWIQKTHPKTHPSKSANITWPGSGGVELQLVCLKELIDLAGEQDHYGAISTLLEPIIAELQDVRGLMYLYEDGLPDKDPGPVFELKKGGAV